MSICPGLWIYGGFGPTGINLQHVSLCADRLGVDIDEGFLRRLKEYERIVLGMIEKKK